MLRSCDKVDPNDFRKAIALLGVFGYVLADMPDRLVAPVDVDARR